MNYKTSERGFKHYEPISTGYGHVIRVYESSTAFDPSLWVAIDGSDAMTDQKAEVCAHLTIEQAERLRDTIDTAIAQHYQQPFDVP
jgi:hypothetical protein